MVVVWVIIVLLVAISEETDLSVLLHECPLTWFHFEHTNTCYKYFGDEDWGPITGKREWGYWRNFCRSVDPNRGELVSIHDEKTNSFILSLASSHFWIGAYRDNTSDVFKWLDGSPWDYNNWDVGQPKSGNHQQNYRVAVEQSTRDQFNRPPLRNPMKSGKWYANYEHRNYSAVCQARPILPTNFKGMQFITAIINQIQTTVSTDCNGGGLFAVGCDQCGREGHCGGLGECHLLPGTRACVHKSSKLVVRS